MKKNHKNILALFSLFVLIGCVKNETKPRMEADDGWLKETKVSKLIKNINFVLPENGYAFDNREVIIKKTFDAIEHNKKILEKSEFNDTIYVRVMESFDEMFVYTGTRAAGNAYPYWSTINIVINENEVNPPIQHEMMHLLAGLDWDYPKRNSSWIDEGIATFAANDCNGDNVAEIYRYLLATERLISIADLTSDFYAQSEMIAYHQSGYIVQYLLENYTIGQFKQLWTDGFEKFEEIYGVPYSSIENDLQKAVIENYPEVPKIDWDVFNKGCQ